MEVWTVEVTIPYEVGYFYGVYSSEERAQERAAMEDVQQARGLDGDIVVACWVLDYDLPPREVEAGEG